jgi:hypothetical protein
MNLAIINQFSAPIQSHFKAHLEALKALYLCFPFFSELQKRLHISALGIEVTVCNTKVTIDVLFTHSPPDLRIADNQEIVIICEGSGFFHVLDQAETVYRFLGLWVETEDK